MNAVEVCGDLWIVFLVVWVVAAFRTKRTRQRIDFASALLYRVPVFVAFYLMFGAFTGIPWLETRLYTRSVWSAILGVSLTALGIFFAIWARFYIGQNWSSAVSVKVDHQLIRSGPYAWVRHPIYSGILLGVLGTAIARREPRGFIAVAVLWAAFLVKSRMEEGFMRTTFGPQYEDYSRSTGALIPRFPR